MKFVSKKLYQRILNGGLAFMLALSTATSSVPFIFAQTVNATTGTDAYVSTTGSGTDCTHAAPCEHFTDALAVATDGGTVHVANGTYNENFTVASGVTIKSDHGKNNVTVNGQITVSHDDAIIRGLTITNPTGTAGVLINDVNGVVVTGNAFENIGTTYTGSSAIQAVYILKTSSNISVDHNTFNNIGEDTNTSSNKAIYVGDSNNGPSANISIDHNTIDGVVASQSAWPAGHGAYGVLVNHQVTGLTLTHNVVRNLDGLWAHAYGLEANTPSAVVEYNSAKYLTDHKGGLDSIAYQFESNSGALTTGMTSDSFSGHQASNSTDTVAVNGSWSVLDTYLTSHPDTYPELYFHGKYYYYGINAFSTVEDGLSHVSAGGVVLVESGAYNDVRATGTYQNDITVKGYDRPTINGLDLSNATFDGLTFKNFIFTGDSNGYGNYDVTVSDNGNYKDLAFVGNVFDGQSVAGRGAIFLNQGFDGFVLQNNTFKNYDGSAVGTVYSVVFAEAQGGTSGQNYTATGNRLTHSTASNFLEAYRWMDVAYMGNNINAQTGRLLVWSDDSFSLGSVNLSNNIVKVHQGTGMGVYYVPGTTVTVNGNTVKNAESCVKLDSVGNSVVSDNTFISCSTNGVKFSQNASTAPNSAFISGNTFESGPVGVENDTTSFVLDACDNTFMNVTTNLYSNPGPFNKIKCEVAPTLISPSNNAVVKGALITNSWSSVPGAVKYQYQSYDYDNLTSLRWDHEYSTTHKTANHVAGGTVFYWRVRGIDAYGDTSPWSELWKVTVDNTAPTATIDNAAPKAYYNNATQISVHAIDTNYAQTDLYHGSDSTPFKTYTGAYFGLFWLQDGNYRMVVRDKAGNSTEYTFTIDKTRPDVSFVVPTDFSAPLSLLSQIKISATDSTSGISGTPVIHVYHNNGDPAVFCNGTTCDTSGLTDGNYYVKAGANDNAGNNRTVTQHFTIDSMAPVVAITSPSNGDVVRGTVTVSGSVTDVNPDHYYLVIKNSSGHVVAGPGVVNTANVADYNWNTSSLPDGTYTIFLAARDAAGNRDGGSEQSVTVTVDNTPPAQVSGVHILQNSVDLGTNAFVNERDVTVDWNDSTDANFDHYQYQADADKATPYDFTTTVSASERSGSIRDQDGTYNYRVRAIDAAGNVGQWSDWVSVTLDRIDPSTPSATYSDNGDGTQNVTLSTGDATDTIYYTTDGTMPNQSSTEYTGAFVLTQGTSFQAIAYDQAGNHSGIFAPSVPIITNEASVHATTNSFVLEWDTDEATTSRVVYDTVSHSTLVDNNVNYGYAFSTVEDSNRVTHHSVLVTGLTPGTTYYFRTVSHGSPVAVSDEVNGTTTKVVKKGSTDNGTPVYQVTTGASSANGTNTADNSDVLGTETQKTDSKSNSNSNKNVLGTSTENSDGVWNIFGLAWYWWLLILAAVAALGRWLYGRFSQANA
ncbi:MAG: chitobiase/beta-hexosaminidase C-terminal domain-containing protein [Candidatus Nomurabacteria bacterium]|nr:MAG: chitobiase/beta-hexosaminidase C-terminal domain-containing protein [Candidatus Nomurabacteria bacterium]